MDESFYQYLFDNSGRIFSFSSTGDKGMDKIVLFTPTAYPDSYAVVLGDLQDDGCIDVNARNCEGDAAFVLSTVAKAIAFFLSDYRDAEVIIEGTTHAHTRLYQIAIVRELDDLGNYFDIYGLHDDGLETFQAGRSYRSFAITLKNS